MAESLSVATIMLFVLLLIRIFFVTYINTHWLGSLGVISVVSFTILYLAKRQKLGWFGRAFLRQTFKINKGKRKYIIYANLVISLIYFASIIYGVDIANQHFTTEKLEVKQELGVDSIGQLQDLTKDKIKITDVPKGILALVYIFFFRFDLYAILVGTINDLTHGYFLHFTIVFTVEIMELMGVLIYSRFYIKDQDISFK